jgi:dipeptidyl aminopeptidase/acylaminoacyl peptidase
MSTFVYRPARTPAPVVVELHGGPEDQWLPRYAGFEQFLVARGYAIVQPNLRGSAGYGEAFLGLDDGPRRADVIADVGAVLDWIATQPDLDAHRVVVMGQSYGGYLALASTIAFPDRLRGAIDIAGIADFVGFLEGTQPFRRDARRAEYGDERDPTTRAMLAQLSPIAHAAEIRRPLLVAHGTRDPRVPIDDAERLVGAVRAAGQPVWYLAAADEGHGFAKSANRGVLEVLAAQFLDEVTRAR